MSPVGDQRSSLLSRKPRMRRVKKNTYNIYIYIYISTLFLWNPTTCCTPLSASCLPSARHHVITSCSSELLRHHLLFSSRIDTLNSTIILFLQRFLSIPATRLLPVFFLPSTTLFCSMLYKYISPCVCLLQYYIVLVIIFHIALLLYQNSSHSS